MKSNILKYFTKEYFLHFKQKCLEDATIWFPAYRYWAGHTTISVCIIFVVLVFTQPFQLLNFAMAMNVGFVLTLFYIIPKEIKDNNPIRNWWDSATDINCTLFTLPFVLFSNSVYWDGFYYLAAFFFIVQVLFFYMTVDLAHQ